mgnify:CR=1 FL=1
MPDDIKLVRIVVKPKKDKDGKPLVTIPKQLNDPFLKKTVELNPDAEVSEEFAVAYCKTYEGYKIVTDPKAKFNKDDYTINESYREPEIAAAVDNLSPAKKDAVYAFVLLIANVDEKEVNAFCLSHGMVPTAGPAPEETKKSDKK